MSNEMISTTFMIRRGIERTNQIIDNFVKFLIEEQSKHPDNITTRIVLVAMKPLQEMEDTIWKLAYSPAARREDDAFITSFKSCYLSQEPKLYFEITIYDPKKKLELSANLIDIAQGIIEHAIKVVEDIPGPLMASGYAVFSFLRDNCWRVSSTSQESDLEFTFTFMKIENGETNTVSLKYDFSTLIRDDEYYKRWIENGAEWNADKD